MPSFCDAGGSLYRIYIDKAKKRAYLTPLTYTLLLAQKRRTSFESKLLTRLGLKGYRHINNLRPIANANRWAPGTISGRNNELPIVETGITPVIFEKALGHQLYRK